MALWPKVSATIEKTFTAIHSLNVAGGNSAKHGHEYVARMICYLTTCPECGLAFGYGHAQWCQYWAACSTARANRERSIGLAKTYTKLLARVLMWPTGWIGAQRNNQRGERGMLTRTMQRGEPLGLLK